MTTSGPRPWSQSIFELIKSNWMLVLVAALFIWMRGPDIWNSLRLEGGQVQVPGLPANQKNVVLFWATWCGPCRIEIERVNKWATAHPQVLDHIFLISVGEDPELVRRTIVERGYQLRSMIDPQGDLARMFSVQVTPSLAFVDEKGVVVWRSSGLSPLLEVRLGHFLSEDLEAVSK